MLINCKTSQICSMSLVNMVADSKEHMWCAICYHMTTQGHPAAAIMNCSNLSPGSKQPYFIFITQAGRWTQSICAEVLHLFYNQNQKWTSIQFVYVYVKEWVTQGYNQWIYKMLQLYGINRLRRYEKIFQNYCIYTTLKNKSQKIECQLNFKSIKWPLKCFLLLALHLFIFCPPLALHFFHFATSPSYTFFLPNILNLHNTHSSFLLRSYSL